jgi:hypothetical protein
MFGAEGRTCQIVYDYIKLMILIKEFLAALLRGKKCERSELPVGVEPLFPHNWRGFAST